jgi:hypothetical protein
MIDVDVAIAYFAVISQIRYIDHVDVQLDNVLEGSSRRRDGRLQILENLLRLHAKVATAYEIAVSVQCNLSRDEQYRARPNLRRVRIAARWWRQILRDLRRATERSIEQANRSLQWIDDLLDQGDEGGRPIPIVIKRRPSVAIASVRSKLDSYDEINRLEKTLLDALPRPAVGELQGVLWHRCADSGCIEGEPFVTLRQRVPSRGVYDLQELPAATLACAYSSMDDDSADKTYKAIYRWTQIKGYRLVGPQREIYHHPMLEIQFPVGPA